MDKYMGLFTQEELQKLAYTRVSENAGDWPKDVLDTLYIEFPSLLPYDVKIHFREKDENRGYGVGSIVLPGLVIPVIIKDYRLAPLDVAIVNQKVVPLTKEALAVIIARKNAFAKLQPSDQEGINSTFNPVMQSAAGDPIVEAPNVVGYEKEASILDKLSGHITKEAKKKLIELSKDPLVKKAAKDNPKISEALEKVAKMKAVDRVDNIEEGLNRKIPRDIHYIYKQGQYRYTGIFGNSQIDSPVIIQNLEEHSIKDFPLIKTAAGSPLTKEERPVAETDIGVPPSSGDYGVLKYANGEATLPFMVDNVTYLDDTFVINAHDGFTKRNFYPLKGISEEIPHELDKCGTYVPTTAKFVHIPVDKQNTALSVGEWENKVYRMDKLSYRLIGPQLAKYAGLHKESDTWSIHDTIWALIATGGSNEDVEKVANLKINEEYTVQTRLRIPVGIDKLAELVQDEINKYAKLDSVSVDFLKMAAYLPENDSVDAVVGLNFLSKINIQEFIKLIPLYEEAASSLARLLISIRMGLEKIPEEPVQRSMQEIMKVIYFLTGVKNLQKV